MDYRISQHAVNVDEFRQLVTSRQRLSRADEDGVRGLLDDDSGVRYVIDEELLFDLSISDRSA